MSSIWAHSEKTPTRLRDFAGTLGCIAAVNAAGAGAGFLAGSGGGNDWYQSLERPSFSPPSWVFAPVWSALYTMMGVSLSILWRARRNQPAANPALQLFTIQFLMNLAWSFLFFRWQNPRGAFVEILILNAVIALTILATWRVSRLAALLLVPYLLWTAFAAVLNGAIWRMNRSHT